MRALAFRSENLDSIASQQKRNLRSLQLLRQSEPTQQRRLTVGKSQKK